MLVCGMFDYGCKKIVKLLPMENKEINVNEVVNKPKRGRKPKDRIYFGEKQEQAVLDYLNSTNQYERNTIYETILEPAFRKMVEAVIRGMDLYIPNEEFQDTYDDTLSHLIEKMGKYKPERGKKAYSYYSNICKNYLIGRKETYRKSLIRNPSYDTLEFDFSNDIKYSDKSDKGKKIAAEEVSMLVKSIQKFLDSPEEYGMRENEIKVGEALINLFENWDYVLPTDDEIHKPSPKLIKSVVFLFLRNTTGLDTKGVRDSLKRYKKEFLMIKKFIIS